MLTADIFVLFLMSRENLSYLTIKRDVYSSFFPINPFISFMSLLGPPISRTSDDPAMGINPVECGLCLSLCSVWHKGRPIEWVEEASSSRWTGWSHKSQDGPELTRQREKWVVREWRWFKKLLRNREGWTKGRKLYSVQIHSTLKKGRRKLQLFWTHIP